MPRLVKLQTAAHVLIAAPIIAVSSPLVSAARLLVKAPPWVSKPCIPSPAAMTDQVAPPGVPKLPDIDCAVLTPGAHLAVSSEKAAEWLARTRSPAAISIVRPACRWCMVSPSPRNGPSVMQVDGNTQHSEAHSSIFAGPP